MEKGLAEKKSQARCGKKYKTSLTIAFLASVAGEKVIELVVIWRSAKPRYFKNLIDILVMCITIQVKNHG